MDQRIEQAIFFITKNYYKPLLLDAICASVRLSKFHIEGLVHITSLGQDFYQFAMEDSALMSLKAFTNRLEMTLGI